MYFQFLARLLHQPNFQTPSFSHLNDRLDHVLVRVPLLVLHEDAQVVRVLVVIAIGVDPEESR